MPRFIIVSIATFMFMLAAFSSGGMSHGHEEKHDKKVNKAKNISAEKKMDHGTHDMGKGDIVSCMHVESGGKKNKDTSGKVVILKPADGAVIHSRSVKVEFDIPDKGSRGNHLHIYLDGRCLNMIRSGTSYHVSGLREGPHRINLRLVDKDHVEYGPEAVTNFQVVKKQTHKN